MSAKAFIEELQGKGVSIWIEGNVIKYKGPSEVLTPDILQTLKTKKQEILQAGKKPTRATGYGCAGCGTKIYQAVEVWETRVILEPSEFKHEHIPVTHWQCEGCGAVFEIVGGSKGPQFLN
jgi:hypothetical protein